MREKRIGEPPNKLDEQWNARFKELLGYRSEHGDCNVPRRGKLGMWVSKQRTAYTGGSLEQERIDRLSSIGFKWAGERYDEQWNARFKELLDYRSEHGDCNVPKGQGKLGTWVINQRQVYVAGSLLQDRIDRLNSLGFKWALGGRVDEHWNARFKELIEYRSEHGDCDVPQKQGKLGTWVNSQRAAYKVSKLSQDRIDRLNSIGFKWALREAAPKVPWETRFDELFRYKTEHGDCSIPTRQAPLGKWVNTQRQQYKKGKLSQDRIDRLISIGFKWTQKEGGPTVPWETRYNELVRYKAKRGDCNIPVSQGQLGKWVNKQRTVYKAGSLAKDRTDRLISIGFKWALKETSPKVPWETRFDELVQYKAKHGDCKVPRSQGQLGEWVDTQRYRYTKSKLAQDRIDRLNNIGFKWALSGKATPWETRFDELVQYKAKHGDCNVPQGQGKLGMWVFKQRQQYKKGKLAQDRIDRLDSIGFDWTRPRGVTRTSRKSKAPDETDSDDDVDEIGALIYDQVMRQTRPTQLFGPEGVPIKTEEIETEDEADTDLFPIKTEETVKYSCETDREDDSITTNDN